MKKALIDTNIISAFMRDNHQVVEKVKEYLLLHDTLTISAITYYELMRGMKALANKRKISLFHEFMSPVSYRCHRLPCRGTGFGYI
jgi:tRNA(fMet)-specific endonuclease VapC